MLDLEAVVSIAERAMETRGVAGRVLRVPSTDVDTTELAAERAVLHAWLATASESAGVRPPRLVSSDYVLDRLDGAQAAADHVWHKIVVRRVTSEATVLHELAHLARPHGDGHSEAFVRVLHGLYLAVLGEAAADVFAGVVGPYLSRPL